MRISRNAVPSDVTFLCVVHVHEGTHLSRRMAIGITIYIAATKTNQLHNEHDHHYTRPKLAIYM